MNSRARRIMGLLYAVALLVATSVWADRERLQHREREIRWRVQGFARAGIMPTDEVEVIVGLAMNEEWEEVEIGAGVTLPNWFTPHPNATARQFRPKGQTYVTGEKTLLAVFTSPRLRRSRAFMIGKKHCFNFAGYVPPLVVKKPEPKPNLPVCVKLRVCKDTENGGSSAGREFLLELETSAGWTEVKRLTTDEDGRASTELRRVGRYRLTEINIPDDYKLVEPSSGLYEFKVDQDDEVVTRRFVNRYCPPVKPSIPYEDQPVLERRPLLQRLILPQGSTNPSESVRQQELATFGAGAAGTSGSRRIRCGQCGRPRPCPHGSGQNIPPEGVVPRTKPPFRPIRPGTGRLPGGY